MANIKDLKKRIKSTKSTLKITSAMKLVSAAKLSRAQQKIVGLKPYTSELDKTVRVVSTLAKNYSHPYFVTSENKNNIMLIISSDKGLCGGYNSNLAKRVRNFFAEHDVNNFKTCFIGKKVKDLLAGEVNAGKHYTFKKAEPTLDEIKAIADELSHMFTSNEVGGVYVAYNTFHSAISQEAMIKKILPMGLDHSAAEKLKEEFPFDFKYEPSPEEILETLIPEVFNATVQTTILDAIAAEHGARMNAMENATKNSKEMIRSLTLKMNKLRQAAITTELIEVVSGAESLNG
jgi:F-type H+-transporting ATPase subunit gamma